MAAGRGSTGNGTAGRGRPKGSGYICGWSEREIRQGEIPTLERTYRTQDIYTAINWAACGAYSHYKAGGVAVWWGVWSDDKSGAGALVARGTSERIAAADPIS